jgi:hypothetical protein
MGFGGEVLPLCGHCCLLVPIASEFPTRETLSNLSSAFFRRAFGFCKLQTEGSAMPGAAVIRLAVNAAAMLKQLAPFVVNTG